ncbi:MAG: polysaccharide biosynthesis/export family protein [Myxococcota bacterium]
MSNATAAPPLQGARAKRHRALLPVILILGVALLALPEAAYAQSGRASGLSAKADPVQAPFAPAGVRDRNVAPGNGRTAAEGSPVPPAGAGLPVRFPVAGRQAPANSLGLASTDSPEGYRVGPGDVIHVDVWQEPDASGDFKVGSAGTIHHYLVGEVGVAGHTVGEIAKVLRDALMLGYLRDPRVSVEVVDYQANKVFIHGEVLRPGVYALRGPTNILKLILDAGGPTRAAGTECTLLQVAKGASGQGVEASTISLDALLVQGDLTQNKQVRNGDVIFVHPREEAGGSAFDDDERSYFVLGEVKNPGAYKYKQGVSAMIAILEAGGFSDFARANKTRLVRETEGGKQEQVVKMGDVMNKGDRSLDVALEPGDVLVVPKSLF